VWWSACVHVPGHVAVQYCKIARGTALPTVPQLFNIRLLSPSATLVLPAGTNVSQVRSNPSACLRVGVTLTGAAPAKAVAVSPAGAIDQNGFQEVLWRAYSDVADHAVGEFCPFSQLVNQLLADQTFNFAVVD